MRHRIVYASAVGAAIAALAVVQAPAGAQELPACPAFSALVLDWPSGTYTQIPGLPLGCFPIVCPVGYTATSPYSDGRAPLTAIGVVIPAPASLPNGFIPAGCTLASGSIIPGPPLTIGGTMPPTSLAGTTAATTPTTVFAGTTPTTVFAGTTPTTVFAGTTPTTVFAGTPPTNVQSTPSVSVLPTTPPVPVATTVFAGPAAVQTGSRLPRTGDEARPLVQLALLLVAGGLALFVGARKRTAYTPKFAAGR